MKIFRLNILTFFHFSPQNIDCGHSLEPPLRGGSNGYPQSMSLSRNKKNNVYPCKPQFYYIKVGLKGVKIIYFRAAQSFFMMVLLYGPDPFSNNSNNSVLPLLQSNLFITTLDITTKFVITIIWWNETIIEMWLLSRNYARTLCLILQETCFGYLLESPQWDDSHKYTKHVFLLFFFFFFFFFFCFFLKIKTIQGLSYITFCSLMSLNSKFILMAASLGKYVVVVTRVHCILL